MAGRAVVQKIVSGGQTGVDRAALDIALECGLACGGWCPKGRKAEDGLIDARYPLRETPSGAYEQRTEWNVRDSDGTLVLTRGPVRGGTADTVAFATRSHKPCLIIDLDQPAKVEASRTWVSEHQIRTLNVAGPRESKSPGIYEQAMAFLHQLVGAQQQ